MTRRPLFITTLSGLLATGACLLATACGTAGVATGGPNGTEADRGEAEALGVDGALVLRGRVIDGTGAPALERGVVVVEEGRIRCVGAAGECRTPRDATIVDAGSGTILPGLIDLHVHARPHYIQMFLAAGITAVRDANNAIRTLREIEAVGPDRPRLFWAGPMLAGPENVLSGIPSAARPGDGPVAGTMPLIVGDPAEGRAAVDSLAAHGASVIKLYEHLPPDAFEAIAERADAVGVRTMADIGMQFTRGLEDTYVDALQALESGIGTLEHMSGFALAYRRLGGDPQAERHDPERIDRLARAVMEGSTVLVPTLISALQFSTESVSLEGVPLADRLHELFTMEWEQRHRMPPAARERAAADLRLARAILKRVIELGGADRIAAGTDAPNPYVVPGGSLHQELELLVEAGLSPLEAIRAAASGAAAVLGRDDLGAVAPGRRADLLVVEGDPGLDIRATRNVRTVILGGRIVDSEALMDEVEAASDALYERLIEEGEIEAFEAG